METGAAGEPGGALVIVTMVTDRSRDIDPVTIPRHSTMVYSVLVMMRPINRVYPITASVQVFWVLLFVTVSLLAC